MLRALMVLTMVGAAAAGAFAFPVDYDIAVTLDPNDHSLVGRETIRWTNTTSEATDELWFHLYLNAFANDRTTFMRGLGGRSLRGGDLRPGSWGWIRIDSMRTVDGVDLMPRLTFERPDDGNSEDFTVARVELPGPVEPGASITLEVAFEAQLPEVIARTGWSGQFHLVGQWYPKVGVFRPAGSGGRDAAEWHCHQFHATTEFFADFGRYRVEVTVPQDFVVAATGVLVEERESDGEVGGTTTLTFAADRVHDFAWCAAPAGLMTVVESDFEPGRDVPRQWLERAAALLDLSAADLELPPVHLRLMVPRTQEDQAERMVRGARLALAWYGLFYGAFPYPQLSLVSPPPGAGEAAGMEYPTFVTTGGSALLEWPPFSWFALNESVTVHEIGHQYFQGLVASNEAEQAWLDEGLTSYTENACIEAIARDGLAPYIRFSNPWRTERLEWALWKEPVVIDQPARAFRTRSEYGTASYTKSALALKTLEGLLGPEVFARGMRSYALSWRWRHPEGRDFQAALSEAAGQDLEWFFSKAFRSGAEVDWKIADVRQARRSKAGGLAWRDGNWSERASSEPQASGGGGEGEPWVIAVDLTREGELTGPVDLLLVFADGKRERRSWDGSGEWKRIALESGSRLAAAVVDPEGVWALESARANNYWRAEPDTSAVRERLWWAFAALRFTTVGLLPWG